MLDWTYINWNGIYKKIEEKKEENKKEETKKEGK